VTQPQLLPTTDLPLESVTVEITRLPDGREAFNVKASAIQHQGLIWERIVTILLGGLRASLAQTVQAPAEPPRILLPYTGLRQ
jgi:hypothetical protein